jgi:nicotinamide mononucleotide transporter
MTDVLASITHVFSVNTVAVTVLGYPLSYVELLGTLFNLWSVWLVARNRILSWPIGIVGVVLFLVLFYQIQLYADTFEQVYYLFASLYGWWYWARSSDPGVGLTQRPRWSDRRTILLVAAGTLLLSLVVGAVIGRLHLWLPALFPVAASFVALDALTTVMSFTAMILMARRRVECWIY